MNTCEPSVPAKREIFMPAALIVIVFGWAFGHVAEIYLDGHDALGLPWWVGLILTGGLFLMVATRLWRGRYEA